MRTSERSEVPARWALWLSFAGAPGLWLVHFLLAYLLVEGSCRAPGVNDSLPTVRWILIVGTAAFALATAALTLFTRRLRVRTEASDPVYDDFLPQVGLLAGLLFTFILLVELASIFFLGVCD